MSLARRTGSPVITETPQPQPKIERALDLIQQTRQVAAVAKATGQTWTQAYQQRQRAKGIANNLKKNQARHATQLHLATAAATSTAPASSTETLSVPISLPPAEMFRAPALPG